MAKIDAATVRAWTKRIDDFLTAYPITREEVTDPRVPWTIAHRVGFWREANDAGINDGPIQTALEKIFPAVKFNDAKRY